LLGLEWGTSIFCIRWNLALRKAAGSPAWECRDSSFLQESNVAQRLPRQISIIYIYSFFFAFQELLLLLFFENSNSDIRNNKGKRPQMALPLFKAHLMHGTYEIYIFQI